MAHLYSIFLKNSGGGEKFIAFIEKELIPHIESTYPAAPYRMLIGHSLGGLTVIPNGVAFSPDERFLLFCETKHKLLLLKGQSQKK